MKRTVEIVIDLQNKIYNTIFLKQLDTTVIKVKILDNNLIPNLDTQTVDIIFTKPDDTIVQQMSSDIDEVNGIATIPLLEDCVRQHGKAKMEIEVKNTNSEVITSFYIPVQIEKTSKENVSSKNTPNYFEEFAKAIDDLKKNSTEMLNNIEKAEETRETNETAREEAEKTRKANETAREEAEKTRKANETTREEAEKTRKANETAREEAEKTRKANETAREEAEKTRKANETARKNAEETREEKIKEIEALAEELKKIDVSVILEELKGYKTSKYKQIIVEDTAKGAEIVIPCKYKVGTNCLDVYLNGDRLIKAVNNDTEGFYYEVGENNTISNKIKLTSDWNAEIDDFFDFEVRGEYE